MRDKHLALHHLDGLIVALWANGQVHRRETAFVVMEAPYANLIPAILAGTLQRVVKPAWPRLVASADIDPSYGLSCAG